MFNKPLHRVANIIADKRGFTLIELLMVIAVIGILVAIVIVGFNPVQRVVEARVASALQFASLLDRSQSYWVIGQWDFDDSGNPAQAKDTSGNGSHGTIIGATYNCNDTPYHIIGQGQGKCSLSFTGNDYMIKNPFNYFPANEITVSFWIKSSASNSGTPVSYGGNNEFLIYNHTNFQIYVGGIATANTGVSVKDTSWHHIAVTWKSSNGNVKIYKDSKESYKGTLQTGYSILNGKSLVLGQDQDAEGGGFDINQALFGSLDDVRIYSHILTAQEIRSQYMAFAPFYQIVLAKVDK